MNFRIIILLIFFTIFCIPIKEKNHQSLNHLVIDAGSSGTRFCLYSIKKNFQCELQNFDDSCYSIPAQNGLADLSEQEIQKVLEQGFKIARQRTSKIDYISLLGTGGFRKLSYQQQQEKYFMIDQYFKNHSFESYQLKFISGKEEAYYAWKSIAILYKSNEHITIETGGATVQFAVGNREMFEYLSLPIGLNQAYERLITYKAFESCKYGNTLSKEGYEHCKNFVQTYVYQNEEIKKFFHQNSHYFNQLKVYTLGRPWTAIFNLLNQNPISLEDLKKAGIYYCSLSSQDLIKKNIPANFTKQICYLFYYHHAQIDALQIQKIYRGTDSWTIGASIDEKTIPYCNSSN